MLKVRQNTSTWDSSCKGRYAQVTPVECCDDPPPFHHPTPSAPKVMGRTQGKNNQWISHSFSPTAFPKPRSLAKFNFKSLKSWATGVKTLQLVEKGLVDSRWFLFHFQNHLSLFKGDDPANLTSQGSPCKFFPAWQLLRHDDQLQTSLRN